MFKDTSLSRLKRHISYLTHRGAIAGKRMSTRGIVRESATEVFATALVNPADLGARDTQKLISAVDNYTHTGKQLNAKLDKLIKNAA